MVMVQGAGLAFSGPCLHAVGMLHGGAHGRAVVRALCRGAEMVKGTFRPSLLAARQPQPSVVDGAVEERSHAVV